jgi:hypothetical protein
MLRTLNPAADIPLLEWSQNLVNYYWHIRVEGRDQAKRRRYYRLIRREKLRLIETRKDLNTDIVNALCGYPVTFNSRRLLNRSANCVLCMNLRFRRNYY